ncbi:hypothetical protein BO996_16485 [Delftia sp. HK171]|uniref:phage capsid family protein n=1 Tax=unclassified Delftia TaxID=2613839 RepID=UPI00020E81B4|nr:MULTISPECIES: DUF4043 family protein [unclassified Delftia]AEF90171.1 hypothetical protein DelCs14_3170 [Delftia sp. Cs1-4]APE49321.1 hypothetical protein BO996_16485 [Delftia sp. HK171]
MGKTVVGVNSPRAVKRFSGNLALDVSQASYFGKRFAAVGQGAKTPLQLLTDLESEAGDLISYDLLAELRVAPVEGDDVLEGKEEGQRFYTDELYIDQARAGVNTGGRMSRNTRGANGQSNAYYENLKRINISENEFKARVRRGEDADSVLADVPLARAHGAAKALDKKISDLRKFRRTVQAGDSPDKRDQIKAINLEIELSMRQLNRGVQNMLSYVRKE